MWLIRSNSGRRAFNHRHSGVPGYRGCSARIEDARSSTSFNPLPRTVRSPHRVHVPRQGAQYVDMGRELYELSRRFGRRRCSYLAQTHLGLDLRSLIYPSESETEVAAQKLQQTNITQPALFVIEYALAQVDDGHFSPGDARP